jgi:hypothetical protein
MIRRAPRPQANFTIIRNDVLRDARLSYRARGVLVSLLSRPDNWRMSAEQLAGETTSEGRDAIRSALRELEIVGYLHRQKVRKLDGTFGHEAVVYDVANTNTQVTPETDYPSPVQPSPVNQSLESRPPKKDCVRTTEEEELERNIDVVFNTWLASTGKDATRTKLDARRRARVAWALKHYPLSEVLEAVCGWRNSPFHCGKNERGIRYNDLTLILRDAQHVEQFRDLERAGDKSDGGVKAWQKLQQMMEDEA